jgi:hypothetical protein
MKFTEIFICIILVNMAFAKELNCQTFDSAGKCTECANGYSKIDTACF